MKIQEILQWINTHTILVYGNSRYVNDFYYVFHELFPNNVVAAHDFDNSLNINGIIFCEDKIYDDNCNNNPLFDPNLVVYKKNNIDIINMYDCFQVLDARSVGYWQYGEKTDVQNRIIDRNKKILLWGLNGATEFFLNYQNNLNIAAIIDNDQSNKVKVFNNIPVKNSCEIEDYSNYYVIITHKDKYVIRDFIEKNTNLQEVNDFIYYEFYGPWGLNASKMMDKTIHDTSIKTQCRMPFDFAYTEINGDIWTCCYAPGVAIGNLLKDKFSVVWKSVFALIIRLSMVNRTYSFCNPYTCIYDINKRGKELFTPCIEDYSLKASNSPSTLSLSHDGSCNLFCESCRNRIIVYKENKAKRSMYISENLIKNVISDVRDVILAGNGEVFVSPAYKKIWSTEIECTVPNGEFHIFTNGQLFTKEKWEKLYSSQKNREISLIVSIDAATEKTYEEIRRNGNWQRLMKNLEYASKLKREKKLKNIILDFVVQRKNIQEMAEFVSMAKSYSADKVMFTAIANWGTYSSKEFEEISILNSDGYLKNEFYDILKDNILKDPIVSLGNIHTQPKR